MGNEVQPCVLAAGDTMPDFHYDTPFAKDVSIAQTAKQAKWTAVLFLRYYGCTLCQYDIQRLAQQYDRITDKGGQALVVLQSDPDKLAQQMTPDDLPFAIVCDPTEALYHRFSIKPAESMVKMADAKTMAKIAKATAAGIKHGDYEGDELQLPAAVVMDEKCLIRYAHYGKSAGDVPDAQAHADLMH